MLDAFRLDGKTAVITGGANGIGFATAKMMQAAGAQVALLDLSLEAAQKAAAKLAAEGPTATGSSEGLVALAVAADVANDDQVDAAMVQIAEQAGGIDILVNCAGVAIRHSSFDHPIEDWDKVVAVNMTGSFLAARAAAKHMVRDGGAVVHMASIMGLSGGGPYSNISYQTTKGAIVNMTRAQAVEWANLNIRVNAVAPTWVRTGFIQPLLDQPDVVAKLEALMPMGRLAETEEVASAILFLASPASAMITGHTLPVDGGFLAQ